MRWLIKEVILVMLIQVFTKIDPLLKLVMAFHVTGLFLYPLLTS